VTAPAGESAAGGVFLRVLVDRGSVEVFNDQGTAMSIAALPDEKNGKLQLVSHGGAVTVTSASVYRMKSAWGK
jgi:sucrose-6-phosphate hydrolase SacC (GH32 family)